MNLLTVLVITFFLLLISIGFSVILTKSIAGTSSRTSPSLDRLFSSLHEIFSKLFPTIIMEKINNVFDKEEKPKIRIIDYVNRLLDPLDNSDLTNPTEIELIDLDSRRRFKMKVNKRGNLENIGLFQKWNKKLIPFALYEMNFGKGYQKYTKTDLELKFPVSESNSLVIPTPEDEVFSKNASCRTEEVLLIRLAENLGNSYQKIQALKKRSAEIAPKEKLRNQVANHQDVEKLKEELREIAGETLDDIREINKIIREESTDNEKIIPQDINMIHDTIKREVDNIKIKKQVGGEKKDSSKKSEDQDTPEE